MFDLLLDHLRSHIDLNDKEIETVRSLFKLRKVRKRQYLLQAGEVSRYENFIVKGLLRSYTVDDDGEEHIVMFGMEGWWISDLYSFLSEQPATQHIDALEDTEVLSIEKADLERLYVEVPQFNKLFRVLLQNAMVANQRRILASISQSAEEKYLSFIKKYPAFEQRIPQAQIALYLGISPETISRIRRQSMK
jgi:CRP-like cAMP-binding protein